jgi:hypothetical protein
VTGDFKIRGAGQLQVIIALGAGNSENLKLTARSHLPTETI